MQIRVLAFWHWVAAANLSAAAGRLNGLWGQQVLFFVMKGCLCSRPAIGWPVLGENTAASATPSD